jgi:hypothetical protein
MEIPHSFSSNKAPERHPKKIGSPCQRRNRLKAGRNRDIAVSIGSARPLHRPEPTLELEPQGELNMTLGPGQGLVDSPEITGPLLITDVICPELWSIR